jgi:hypothetical protein
MRAKKARGIRERAAYKKPLLGLSSKPRLPYQVPGFSYFGLKLGLQPGLPGGGITGVLPASGVGARISGSTPAGGHNTPPDLASLSPSVSPAWPVVEGSGAIVPRGGTALVGAQSLALAAGAVSAGGVVGAGGACAIAASAEATNRQETRNACFFMRGERRLRKVVPPRMITVFRSCESGSAKNVPLAASAGVRPD